MDEEGYTPQQRREILVRMQRASDAFYTAAVMAGCHAFIEFTGLMNEFIKVCREAEADGKPWVSLNAHGDEHLAMAPYEIAYVREKLECIYGEALLEPTVGRIAVLEKQRDGWRARAEEAEAVLASIAKLEARAP